MFDVRTSNTTAACSKTMRDEAERQKILQLLAEEQNKESGGKKHGFDSPSLSALNELDDQRHSHKL